MKHYRQCYYSRGPLEYAAVQALAACSGLMSERLVILKANNDKLMISVPSGACGPFCLT